MSGMTANRYHPVPCPCGCGKVPRAGLRWCRESRDKLSSRHLGQVKFTEVFGQSDENVAAKQRPSIPLRAAGKPNHSRSTGAPPWPR